MPKKLTRAEQRKEEEALRKLDAADPLKLEIKRAYSNFRTTKRVEVDEPVAPVRSHAQRDSDDDSVDENYDESDGDIILEEEERRKRREQERPGVHHIRSSVERILKRRPVMATMPKHIYERTTRRSLSNLSDAIAAAKAATSSPEKRSRLGAQTAVLPENLAAAPQVFVRSASRAFPAMQPDERSERTRNESSESEDGNVHSLLTQRPATAPKSVGQGSLSIGQPVGAASGPQDADAAHTAPRTRKRPLNVSTGSRSLSIQPLASPSGSRRTPVSNPQSPKASLHSPKGSLHSPTARRRRQAKVTKSDERIQVRVLTVDEMAVLYQVEPLLAVEETMKELQHSAQHHSAISKKVFVPFLMKMNVREQVAENLWQDMDKLNTGMVTLSTFINWFMTRGRSLAKNREFVLGKSGTNDSTTSSRRLGGFNRKRMNDIVKSSTALRRMASPEKPTSSSRLPNVRRQSLQIPESTAQAPTAPRPASPQSSKDEDSEDEFRAMFLGNKTVEEEKQRKKEEQEEKERREQEREIKRMGLVLNTNRLDTEKIMGALKKIDQDGNGQIDETEFRQALANELGEKAMAELTDTRLHRVWMAASGGKATVDAVGFAKWWKKTFTGRAQPSIIEIETGSAAKKSQWEKIATWHQASAGR